MVIKSNLEFRGSSITLRIICATVISGSMLAISAPPATEALLLWSASVKLRLILLAGTWTMESAENLPAEVPLIE